MLSLIGFSLSSTSDIASDPQFPQFERCIRQHRGGTPYGSEQETIARFSIFKDTLATIDARNAVGKEKHGVTKFADLTPAEFKAKHTGLAPTTAKSPAPSAALTAKPSLMDAANCGCGCGAATSSARLAPRASSGASPSRSRLCSAPIVGARQSATPGKHEKGSLVTTTARAQPGAAASAGPARAQIT